MTQVEQTFSGPVGDRVTTATTDAAGDPMVVNPAPSSQALTYSNDFLNPVTGGTVMKVAPDANGVNLAEVRHVMVGSARGALQYIARWTGFPDATTVVAQMRGATFQHADQRITSAGLLAGNTTGTTAGVATDPLSLTKWVLVDVAIQMSTAAVAPFNGLYKWRYRELTQDATTKLWTIGAVVFEYTSSTRNTGIQGTDPNITDWRGGDFTTTAVMPTNYWAYVRANDTVSDYLPDPTLYVPGATIATDKAVYEPGETITLILGGGTTASVSQTAGKSASLQVTPAGQASAIAPHSLTGETVTFSHSVTESPTPVSVTVQVLRSTRRQKRGASFLAMGKRPKGGAAPNSVPTPVFTTVSTGNEVVLDATGSSDLDGTIVSYEVDWADGSRSITDTPTQSHVYAQAGTYGVTLTVTDNRGEAASLSQLVEVGASAVPMTTVGGLRVTSVTKDTISLAWNPATGGTGGITSYRVRLATKDATGAWGSDIFYGTVNTTDNAGPFTYTITGRTIGTDYRPSVEPRDSTGRFGPRAYVETKTVSDAPIVPFTGMGQTLATHWSTAPTSATTAADATDPTLTRVSAVAQDDGTFALSLSQATVTSQPFLVTEGTEKFMRFDGVNDRLFNSASTTLLRNRPTYSVGIRFRANTTQTGVDTMFQASNSYVNIALTDGILRVGGRRISTDTSEYTTYPGVDLRDFLWHTVVALYDYFGAHLTVLLDGVVVIDVPFQVAGAGTNSADANHSVSLGSTTVPGEYWAGDIEEVASYRALLTVDQAKELHRTLAAGSVPAGALAAPTGISSVPGNNDAIVSWNAVTAAASYSVLRLNADGTTTQVASVAAPATSATISGLVNGTPYTFGVKTINTDGVASALSLTTTVTPTGVTVGIPAPGDIDGNIRYARAAYYPDGTGRDGLLQADYKTWKTGYWVPSNSTFQSPNGEPVFRGQRCRGGTTTVLDYTQGTNCLRIMCPEVFTNLTLGRWGEVDNWMGVIVQGFHMNNPSFLGTNTDWPTYKSTADTLAQTNGITPVRPGYWKYNPWSTGLTGDAATIDNRVGVGRMHERSIYTRPGSGVTGKAFYSLEGTYLEGDWVIEGLNVNGIGGNARQVVAGYRHDRVSVYFRKDPTTTDVSAKWPGGDSIQVFGALNDLMIVGGTAYTHYQALFLQHSSQQKIHVINWGSKTATISANGDATYYGGDGGYQAWPGTRQAHTEWFIKNWHVWRRGIQTIDNADDFPEITSVDSPEFIPRSINGTLTRIGIRYAAAPVPV